MTEILALQKQLKAICAENFHNFSKILQLWKVNKWTSEQEHALKKYGTKITVTSFMLKDRLSAAEAIPQPVFSSHLPSWGHFTGLVRQPEGQLQIRDLNSAQTRRDSRCQKANAENAVKTPKKMLDTVSSRSLHRSVPLGKMSKHD